MLPFIGAITVSRNSKRHPVSSLFSPAVTAEDILHVEFVDFLARLKFRWHGVKDSDRPKGKQDDDSKEPRSSRPFCQKFQNF